MIDPILDRRRVRRPGVHRHRCGARDRRGDRREPRPPRRRPWSSPTSTSRAPPSASEILAGEGLRRDAVAGGRQRRRRRRRRWSHEVSERLGPPSVLVNNAGIVTVAPSDELPEDEWRRQVDVMLTGTFLTTQAVARTMLREGGGAVVNLSSIGGVRRAPRPLGLQRGQGRDLVPDPGARRRVGGAWHPGQRRRPGGHAHRDARARAADARGRDQARRSTPRGRRWGGSPSRRRSPSAWRSWHPTKARFVTGTTLLIDGGWMASAGLPAESRRERLRRHRRHRRLGRLSSPRTCGARCIASRPGRRRPGSTSSRASGGPTRRRSSCGRPSAADEHLPEGAGAAFIAVVPVWGVIASPHDEAAELAAARGSRARPFADRALVATRDGGSTWSPTAALGRPTLPGLRTAAVLADRTPMHRLASVAELANAIDFLSSSAASYVTGSVLPSTAAGRPTPGSTPPATSSARKESDRMTIRSTTSACGRTGCVSS